MFYLKKKLSWWVVCISLMMLSGFTNFNTGWKQLKKKKYNYFHTVSDFKNEKVYQQLLNKGIKEVENFFGSKFKSKFSVYIHPNRSSLDSTWQTDWKMPDFKSECWMVASGVAERLDMISPKKWDETSCEHKYAENIKTQQLITHELVHVFHGQLNASPDFSNTEGIDWFVEGLATYASGQCDSLRIAEVKKALSENKLPDALDKFWTGKFKYGLSGSIVMYIDEKYGRERTKELLSLTAKSAILSRLNISEAGLLENWKEFLLTK